MKKHKTLALNKESIRLLDISGVRGGRPDNTIDESACAPTHDGPTCVSCYTRCVADCEPR